MQRVVSYLVHRHKKKTRDRNNTAIADSN